METTIGQRLKKVIDHYRYSKRQAALAIGISAPTLGNAINDKNVPGYDVIGKVIKLFPEVNAEWLLIGKGEMIPEKVSIVSEPQESYGVNYKEKFLECSEKYASALEQLRKYEGPQEQYKQTPSLTLWVNPHQPVTNQNHK